MQPKIGILRLSETIFFVIPDATDLDGCRCDNERFAYLIRRLSVDENIATAALDAEENGYGHRTTDEMHCFCLLTLSTLIFL